MSKLRVLWVDPETMWCWETTIRVLEVEYGFKITKLGSTKASDVLRLLLNQNAVAIHCGTISTISNLEELLREIRTNYPLVAIGLLTNVIHPTVRSLVNFYIQKPTFTKDIAQTVRKSVAHVRANRRS